MKTNKRLHFRKATLEDVDRLCELRKQQLIDEGIDPCVTIDEELHDYFMTQLSNETLIEWVAEDEHDIVATGALVVMAFPPTYTNSSGIKGYVTNMYTAPAYRRQGIATKMLDLLSAEAKQRGITKLFLGASKMGRFVYEAFGFQDDPTFMVMDV